MSTTLTVQTVGNAEGDTEGDTAGDGSHIRWRSALEGAVWKENRLLLRQSVLYDTHTTADFLGDLTRMMADHLVACHLADEADEAGESGGERRRTVGWIGELTSTAVRFFANVVLGSGGRKEGVEGAEGGEREKNGSPPSCSSSPTSLVRPRSLLMDLARGTWESIHGTRGTAGRPLGGSGGSRCYCDHLCHCHRCR